MFGYVTPNFAALSKTEQAQYRAYYCGVCRSLARRYGALARFGLTYDLTFLALVLAACEPEPPAQAAICCALHPLRPHPAVTGAPVDYAADLNTLLLRDRLLDRWVDDRSLFSAAGARLLQKQANAAAQRHPRQSAVIRAELEQLAQAERAGVLNPDVPGGCFGRLTGALFVPDSPPPWAEALERFGFALGKFIYVLDACDDFCSDLRRERYNPMAAVSSGQFGPVLHMLMARCTDAYERLPIRHSDTLLRNVLYSGIWARAHIPTQERKTPS